MIHIRLSMIYIWAFIWVCRCVYFLKLENPLWYLFKVTELDNKQRLCWFFSLILMSLMSYINLRAHKCEDEDDIIPLYTTNMVFGSIITGAFMGVVFH